MPIWMVLLAGCASSPEVVSDRAGRALADGLPHWAGGEPASAPRPPAIQRAYPSIFVEPPARSTTPLDADAQKALQADLVAVRDRVEEKSKAARASEPPNAPRIMAADPEPTEPPAATTAGTAAN